MPPHSLQKQISIFLPIDDWRRLRAEAARQHLPITEVCRRWIRPGLSALKQDSLSHDRAEPVDVA